jgi:hypothetical protein
VPLKWREQTLRIQMYLKTSSCTLQGTWPKPPTGC